MNKTYDWKWAREEFEFFTIDYISIGEIDKDGKLKAELCNVRNSGGQLMDADGDDVEYAAKNRGQMEASADLIVNALNEWKI